MKLLFDENLSYRLCALLSDLFPGSEQVSSLGLELVALKSAPPKLVWLRCGNRTTAFIERLLRDCAAAIAAFAGDPDAACLEIYDSGHISQAKSGS